MLLPVTTLTLCAITGLFLFLSIKIISIRRREKISIGDGGNETMHSAIRAQGNLLEYSVFALALLALAEAKSANIWLLIALAGLFLIGRLMHAYTLGFGGPFRFRPMGMRATVLALVALVVTNLVYLVI